MKIQLTLKPSLDSSRDRMSLDISIGDGESKLRDFLDRFFSEVEADVAVNSASPEELDPENSGGDKVENDSIPIASDFG